MKINGSDNQRVREILKLPDGWNKAGSVSNKVLNAILKYCTNRGRLEHSIETGTGKTTLLFSHISKHHLVFSVDPYDHRSVSTVKTSPLLNRDCVQFVNGPTQKTLPNFHFSFKVQAALIDGPHAWPFPDMEYYYIYQILDEGAVLIVDDIHIPSIRSMFNVIKADEMFMLLEVVGNTAFFQRTDQPMFDALADGWWLQGYNKPLWDEMMKEKAQRSAQRRALADRFPEPLKRFIPTVLKRAFWKRM
jgi:hypothetical protein